MMKTARLGWSLSLSAASLFAAFALACGTSVAPQELKDARDAYAQAKQGVAAKLAPAHLETAKQALDDAERAFQDDGDDQVTKDLAYVALRKVELATLQGKLEKALRERSTAIKQRQELTEKRLKSAEGELTEKERALRDSSKELESERQKRLEAERKAAEALASLRELASVKEESRGIVITLSGAVLFATGKYDLLPIARSKLKEVAEALDEGGYKKIVVEGHTDSRGRESANQILSLRRAESVRAELVSNGIDSSKIEAIGKGESSPVAPNDSPEGRANNRRVELIVTPDN